MIFGIGVDCEKISRFENLKESFLKKVFTASEISYCKSKKNSSQHFAARFTAKEAVKKAMAPLGLNISFTDIEVIKKNIYPEIKLRNKDLNKNYSVTLSICHSDEIAMAFVIVQGEKNGRKIKSNIH